MNREILQLASDANEAVIAYRDSKDNMTAVSFNPMTLVARANFVMEAVDKLTGAIIEEANR